MPGWGGLGGLSLNRSQPAKKSGHNTPKNRCRTTVTERMVETLAELPFIGDQVVCLSPRPGRPQRTCINLGNYRKAKKVLKLAEAGLSYRLIGRDVGLSKNTVGAILQRARAANQ